MTKLKTQRVTAKQNKEVYAKPLLSQRLMKHHAVFSPLKCLSVVCIALSLFACKPGVPKGVIKPGKMERILYDYQLAEGMAYVDANYSTSDQKRMEYLKAVFEKHGITKADFDSSMVYYYRHCDQLHDIYVKVNKRLQDESVALGAQPKDNELGQFGKLTHTGDTALIWNDATSAVLMPYPPFNLVSFSVKPDSTMHKGDKVMLIFDTQFIFQDGSKDAYAFLSVVLANDSIASQNLRLYSDSHYSLQIVDNDSIGVKEIKGFVGLMRGQNNDSETLKLLSLKNMALIRMRTTPKPEEQTTPPATEQTTPLSDSLTRDSIGKNKPSPLLPPRTLKEKMEAEGLERHN